MVDTSRQENAAAEREARDAVPSRPETGGSGARSSALRRFLGAESYREKQIEDAGSEGPKARKDEERS